LDRTIGAYFDQATDRWADGEALVSCHQSIRWRYCDLREGADAFALGLLALGLEPGERIAVWSPNCAEWAVAQYGAAKAGLILVGINPAYRAAELEYALNKVEAAAIVLPATTSRRNFWPMLRELAPQVELPGQQEATTVPSLRIAIGIGEATEPGLTSFARLIAKGAREDSARLGYIAARQRHGDPALIQFTSGTTGPPKAATLSHFNVINAASFGAERLGITSSDRICIPVPLFHSFGMIGGNLLALGRGATAIYPGAAFDPGATLAAVVAERCTVVYGVPAMFGAEMNHPSFTEYDLQTLRTGIIAGAPCPAHLMQRIMRDMHIPELVTAFGMSETSAAGLATARDDPLERRTRTVGRVTAHTEIKVIDDQGVVVPRGTVGELCTRGFAVMSGYWNDPEATAEAIDGAGWMHTGDLVALDDAGYGTVFGRSSDVVNRGGEKILPGEIESFLLGHPAVEAVQVFGIPDEKRGEELCAWIKLKPGQEATPEQIRSFCRGKIANFKIPRHIRFVDAFPMTVTGKVQKYMIKAEMRAKPDQFADRA